jgi:hypothetical protein
VLEGTEPCLSIVDTIDEEVVQSFDLLCAEAIGIRPLGHNGEAYQMSSSDHAKPPRQKNLHLPGICTFQN